MSIRRSAFLRNVKSVGPLPSHESLLRDPGWVGWERREKAHHFLGVTHPFGPRQGSWFVYFICINDYSIYIYLQNSRPIFSIVTLTFQLILISFENIKHMSLLSLESYTNFQVHVIHQPQECLILFTELGKTVTDVWSKGGNHRPWLSCGGGLPPLRSLHESNRFVSGSRGRRSEENKWWWHITREVVFVSIVLHCIMSH